MFFRFFTKRECDGRTDTDGQTRTDRMTLFYYDLQDRASIAASRSKNMHFLHQRAVSDGFLAS